MAQDILTVKVEWMWFQELIDGKSKCKACGDLCYTSQWRLWLSVVGELEKTDKIICGCCNAIRVR